MMGALELKAPPVALAAALALLMWLAAVYIPVLAFPFPDGRSLSIGMSAAGALVGLAGVAAFRRARTTVDPTKPGKASVLVASGIYRASRNPMYVGLLPAPAAWAAHLSNLLALAALPAFVWYMNRFQIVPEERALRARFGSAFTVQTSGPCAAGLRGSIRASNLRTRAWRRAGGIAGKLCAGSDGDSHGHAPV